MPSVTVVMPKVFLDWSNQPRKQKIITGAGTKAKVAKYIKTIAGSK